jgi:hypothetical protein
LTITQKLIFFHDRNCHSKNSAIKFPDEILRVNLLKHKDLSYDEFLHCTGLDLQAKAECDCFIPRSREGSDGILPIMFYRPEFVSIHAPVKGATADQLP